MPVLSARAGFEGGVGWSEAPPTLDNTGTTPP